MQSIVDFFVDVWNIPAARGVIGLAVIVTLVLILIYIVKQFRGAAFGHERSEVLDHLSDFRQMLDEGKIDQQDYKRLKSELSKQALEESKGISDLDPGNSEPHKPPPGKLDPEKLKEAIARRNAEKSVASDESPNEQSPVEFDSKDPPPNVSNE